MRRIKIILFCLICHFVITHGHLAIAQSSIPHSIKKISRKDQQKTVSITILGAKNGKDTSLKEFEGSWFGLNLSYLRNINEAEKAVLGLITTYAGTECEEWDAAANRSTGNFNCKLTKTLGLGYQCSETHLGFVRKWFRNDTAVLKELKECAAYPNGASTRISFGKIILTKSPGFIKIFFVGEGASIRSEKTWEWTETFLFKVETDQVKLIKRTINKAHTF